MPEWLLVPLLSLGGTALLAGAAFFGHVVSSRAQKRATEVQVAATKSTAENALIDQLQEELTTHRTAAEKRMTAQDERMNRLEQQSDGYRSHAHELRAHIWDGKPPPPPPWPVGLPQ